MEQLVVRLGSNAEQPVHWLVWSPHEQEIIASGELANAEQLNTLAQRAGQRPITVLVPTSDVYLKTVDLPPKAGRKALAALPFMLEDELTTDISQLFFAVGEKHGNQQSVAIVDKNKIQTWLNIIEQAGLHCDKIIPDVLTLESSENNWSLINLGDQLLVRQGIWQGIQGANDWILQAIEHYSKRQTEPLIINNYSDIELPHLANIELQQMPLELPMLRLAQGALDSKFNLLQGDFKQKRKNTNQWHKWRLAAGLAAIALLTTLIDKGMEINRLSTENSMLTAQLAAEYKRGFPNAGGYRNLRKAVGDNMARLSSTGGSSSLLTLMSQLSEAFAQTDVKPQTLRFDSSRSEIRMQAVANNFESLETFKRMVEELGFEVQQGSINNKDSQVIGSLSIRS